MVHLGVTKVSKTALFCLTGVEALVGQWLRQAVDPSVASCAAVGRLDKACCLGKKNGVLPQSWERVGNPLFEERHSVIFEEDSDRV